MPLWKVGDSEKAEVSQFRLIEGHKLIYSIDIAYGPSATTNGNIRANNEAKPTDKQDLEDQNLMKLLAETFNSALENLQSYVEALYKQYVFQRTESRDGTPEYILQPRGIRRADRIDDLFLLKLQFQTGVGGAARPTQVSKIALTEESDGSTGPTENLYIYSFDPNSVDPGDPYADEIWSVNLYQFMGGKLQAQNEKLADQMAQIQQLLGMILLDLYSKDTNTNLKTPGLNELLVEPRMKESQSQLATVWKVREGEDTNSNEFGAQVATAGLILTAQSLLASVDKVNKRIGSATATVPSGNNKPPSQSTNSTKSTNSPHS